MSGYNRVVVLGNLTRTPEIRQIPSGKTVSEFGLAINERYKDAGGQYVERTCFVDIVAWGRQAEICGQYLDKGRSVLIEGRLQLDRWETREGDKRSKLRVRADRIQLLPRAGIRRDHDTRHLPAAGDSAQGVPVAGAMEDVPF